MHNARLGLWVVALIGMLASGAERAGAEERPLVWAADTGGGEPYVFDNPEKQGEILGFEADLRDALARELGRPIIFKQYEFGQLEQGLDRRDFDFAMNGLEITASRKQKVLFTRPYYVYRLGLVVRVGDDRFQSLDDVQKQPGAVIGTLDASYAQELLGSRFAPESILALTAQDQIYDNLVNKRTDAVYLDTIINATYLEKKNYSGLRPVGEPGDKGYYGIAVRKDNEPMRRELDEALGRIIASGELRRIYNKWYIWNYDQYELGRTTVVDTGSADEWRVSNYLPLLVTAAWVTVKLSVVSFAIAVVIGLAIALMRLYGPVWMKAVAVAYVEFFRGIPVLFLVLFLYFALPGVFRAVGLEEWGKLEAFYVAVIALGLNYAAYEAEIYRAGVCAVPFGQWEAARSLGMSGPLTFRRIVLPQAVKIILPPMTGDFIALFKDTSVVSFIGVVELSNQFQRVAKNSLNYLEVGLITAALYLIMSVPLGYLSRRLEKRWGHAAI